MTENDGPYELIEFLVPGYEEEERARKKTRTKSKLWAYFNKLDERTASCLTCLKVLRTSGNTTNLAKHLRLHSTPNSTNDPTRAAVLSITPSDNNLEQKVSSIDISQKMFEREIRSDANSTEITPGMKSLNRVGHYLNGGSRHVEVTNYLLYFICADNKPFSFVQGKGFQKFLKNILPLYKVPNQITLQKHLDEKYELMQSFYLEKFSQLQHVSLSCDTWTDSVNLTNYLIITVHYLDEGNLQSAHIDLCDLTDYNTPDYIGQQLMKALRNWNINASKVVAVVTDSDPNVVEAVHGQFGRQRHIPCLIQMIYREVEKVLQNQTVKPIVSKIRSIVNWITENPSTVDEIKKRQIETGIPEDQIKTLTVESGSKWNATYEMLNNFIGLSNILDEILLNESEISTILSQINFPFVKELLLLLRPLDFVMKEASKDLYMPASNIIPIINCVTDEYSLLRTTNPLIESLKTNIYTEFTKNFAEIELESVIALSTLLDPRFKNLHFQDPMNSATVLKSLLKTAIPSNEAESASNQYDFWSYHKNFLHSQNANKKKIKIDTIDDVLVYLNSPVTPLWINPLTQWDEAKSIYPGLYNLAMKYFTAPATSVPVERLFSREDFISAMNGHLGKQAQQRLFLGSCKDDEWF